MYYIIDVISYNLGQCINPFNNNFGFDISGEVHTQQF